MHAVLYFDGGARPTNPGPAGFASVVLLEDEEHVISRYIGFKTNNEAEYHGLIVGIKYASNLGAESIEIYTDSKLIEGHICLGWRRESFKLQSLARDVDQLLERMFPETWSLSWIKREENSRADKLCTEAILSGKKTNPFLRKAGVPVQVGRVIDPFASPSA